MHHGLYNNSPPHVVWVAHSMHPHGPWVVQGFNKIQSPCMMGCATLVKILHPHAPWVAQGFIQDLFPMHDGLCSSTSFHAVRVAQQYTSPCSMGCARLHIRSNPHASWVVQWYTFPCGMSCATIYISMVHGLCISSDGIHSPYIMDCMVGDVYCGVAYGVAWAMASIDGRDNLNPV